jgi:26S proteasome regulatory subunit N1
MIYFLVSAMYPRFFITLDESLEPIKVTARVGQVRDRPCFHLLSCIQV